MVTLQLDDVGAAYAGQPILNGVSTPRFEAGEVVALIGPNAAGKSTLFRRVAGLLAGPGVVRFGAASQGQAGVCYMPQDGTVTARLTAYESILLACKQQQQGWTVRPADLVRIDAVMAGLDIEALAFRTLDEMSGGQRQLVSIAQVLVRDPDILLMDEPTSALDMRRQVQVLSLLQALARQRGKIVVVALHDLNQALQFADQVVVLARGRALHSGRCEEVITPAMLRDVYQVDARVERCSRGGARVIVDGVA
ncbi:ABC transporter ATP-binding protein [Variovorax sp. LT1R16]|uniref:ABC transporter ATP-binding protein n=1 Tax=Variovorax sp. LT1R16 TaxID=3443728 RepID=UPI003F462A05